MKMLTLNAYGSNHNITLATDRYVNNNNLYVQMLCHDEAYVEPWCDLTVNLGIKLPDNCAFVDVNNNGEEICQWLEANNLAKPTGRIVQSGFVAYPEYQFNMDVVAEYLFNAEEFKEANTYV